MSRFLDHPARKRIAAIVTHDYPSADETATYERIEAVAKEVGADVEFFYSVVPDPRSLPTPIKKRLGRGMYMRRIGMMHEADGQHFRAVCRSRYDGLLAILMSATGQSESDVLARYDVQAAFTFARMIQAWHGDVIVACYLDEHSFFAAVASHLLGIPSVFLINWVEDGNPYAIFSHLICSAARAIVLGHPAMVDRVACACGEEFRHKLHLQETTDSAVVRIVREALAEPRGADLPELGATAAFVTLQGRTSPTPTGPRPFVIIGAERTGSNLLVDALASQSGIECAGELFNPRVIEEGSMPWLGDPKQDIEGLVRLRAADPPRFHARLLADGAARGASWVGFKLLYFHGAIDNRVVDYLAGLADLKIVHLLRRNRIARWFSHHKAIITDTWYTAAGAGRAKRRQQVEIDAVEAAADFAYVEMMEDRYRAIFDPVRCLEMDYEDFSSDMEGTRRRLSDFFEVELGEIRPVSEKTGVRVEEGVSNFAELRTAFRGTRWEHLFSD